VGERLQHVAGHAQRSLACQGSQSKPLTRGPTILTARPCASAVLGVATPAVRRCWPLQRASLCEDAGLAPSDERPLGGWTRPPSRQPTHLWAPTDVLDVFQSTMSISTAAWRYEQATATRGRPRTAIVRVSGLPVKNVDTRANDFACATLRISRARCRDASCAPVSAIAARISV
jgi:hypothetical protein